MKKIDLISFLPGRKFTFHRSLLKFEIIFDKSYQNTPTVTRVEFNLDVMT